MKPVVLIPDLVTDPKNPKQEIPTLVYFPANGAVVHKGATLVRLVYCEGRLLEALLDTTLNHVLEAARKQAEPPTET